MGCIHSIKKVDDLCGHSSFIYSLHLESLESDDAKDATESMGILSLDENQEVHLSRN